MEKFGLLNLIKALSGQSEQSGCHTVPGTQQSAEQQSTENGQTECAAERANLLAGIIERHDAMSYRLKNKR